MPDGLGDKMFSDANEYRVFLKERDLKNLKELKGFLAGLEAGGKKVPGSWTFNQLEENLRLIEKREKQK